MDQNVLETKAPNLWTGSGRLGVFILASSSIACLLSDFYRICSMRLFVFAVFLPAMGGLLGYGLFDRAQGNRKLWHSVLLGLGGGLLAAVAFDAVRLPFVYSKAWGLAGFIPPMDLFKVFPQFGAMILGQPINGNDDSALTDWIGWAYHFSNGATFGIMYVAMIGEPARRHWFWAVLMAVGIELGMLLTPYPHVFGIPLNQKFVIVTLTAHAIFGVCLGISVRQLSRLRKLRLA